MAFAELIVSDPDRTWRAMLNPEGTTIGRSPGCDIILEREAVSRHHARVYQDPFGRWVVEDIGSQNGIWVEGRQIKAQVIAPRQKFSIAPFTLTLVDEVAQAIMPESPNGTTFPVIDKNLEEDIVSYEQGEETVLSSDLMPHLNDLTDRLMGLSSPPELYSELCSCLARMFDALVVVVRLSNKPESSQEPPDILACRFGHRAVDAEVFRQFYPHLSKRVLAAVCTKEAPVMASSETTSDKKMVLTVVDEHEPHIVFAARVNESADMIDALYIDMIEARLPEGMFDFTVLVARQVNLIQKKLFLIELIKKEKALSDANVKLKEKDRIKDEYVSRVTHDIKGHLAAIQNCLYVVSDKSSGELSEKQADFLTRSRRRAVQLSDFTNELLDLTRMRLSGQLKRAPFALKPCISKALENVASKAEEKSIKVSSLIEPSTDMIVGDNFSINEMLSNLLFNAVKYTSEGKTVYLEAKSDDDWVQIVIADTGIGIPTDEVDHIFEEFFRASNGKQFEQDGTGLGLSIVKHIVERHGGEITVKSQEGKGTTFTVRLPKGDVMAKML